MQRRAVSERERLRRFGLVMALAFTVLGAFLLLRGREWGVLGPYLAGGFLSAGLLAPSLLGPLERAWMRLAGVMQVIMTRVVLTLTFFVVITPLGLFMRLIRSDHLGKDPDPELESYWIPVEPGSPGSRPHKPY